MTKGKGRKNLYSFKDEFDMVNKGQSNPQLVQVLNQAGYTNDYTQPAAVSDSMNQHNLAQLCALLNPA